MFKGIIQKLDGDEHNVFCLICRKTISIAHQGEKDLKRHCDGSTHSNKVSTARLHKDIRSTTYKKDSDTDKMARLAEVRFTGFLICQYSISRPFNTPYLIVISRF